MTWTSTTEFEVDGGGSDAPDFDVEPYDDTEYDTGPFCRHYADPTDCDHKCLRCNHECHEHDQDMSGSGKCNHDDCECHDWLEEDG
jgi:hypothetical protein